MGDTPASSTDATPQPAVKVMSSKAMMPVVAVDFAPITRKNTSPATTGRATVFCTHASVLARVMAYDCPDTSEPSLNVCSSSVNVGTTETDSVV